MLHAHVNTNNKQRFCFCSNDYVLFATFCLGCFNRTLRGSGHKIRMQGILISSLGPVMDYSRSFRLSSPPSPQILDTTSKNKPRNACFQVKIHRYYPFIRHYITCEVERRHSINQDLADNRKDEMGGV
jgi:hypothetical protein